MSKNRKKIVQAIQGMTAPVEEVVMSGYVKDVDEDKATMSVVLNISGQVIEGVLLHALSNSLKGIIVIPEQDSDVVICSVDGSGEYMMLKCDKVKNVMWDISTEIDVKCDKIVFNGGENHGMVKVEKLVERLNNIERDINKLKSAFSGWIVAPQDGGMALYNKLTSLQYYSQQLQETQQSDLENTKIKH